MKKISNYVLLPFAIAAQVVAADLSPDSPENWNTIQTFTNATASELSFPNYWSKRWRVTKLEGHFSTYSAPREDTYCELIINDLLKGVGQSRIEFTAQTNNAHGTYDWYMPYHQAFRVTKIQNDHDGNVVGIKLIAERGKDTYQSVQRWTLSLKNGRGFLIYEMDEIITGVVALVAEPQ
jgi:hypothetical protein